jgi:hypothetical protein
MTNAPNAPEIPTPANFWVKLDNLNLEPGDPVKKLELVAGRTYNGNAAEKSVDALLFHFSSLEDTFEPAAK